MLESLIERIQNGHRVRVDEALKLAETVPVETLCRVADELRRSQHQDAFDLCSIINAKSGKCSENCRFCAQSSFYSTEIETYEQVEVGTALQMAKHNEAHGVQRFSLVTAGRSVSERNLQQFAEIYKQLGLETNLSLCASMGFLTEEKAAQLRAAGVSRYHCNLEACRSYFPEVCTTHTWEEKVETINLARKAGMDICSGGIIGMGENRRQRFELADELRELEVLSIPINILSPIPNTPFADIEPISREEVLLTIAMFRLMNPKAVIRLAGGRGMMGEEQEKCFTSGANGAIVGDYLTTIGQDMASDLVMFRRLGFSVPIGPGK